MKSEGFFNFWERKRYWTAKEVPFSEGTGKRRHVARGKKASTAQSLNNGGKGGKKKRAAWRQNGGGGDITRN